MNCRLLCFALLASSAAGFAQDLSVHVTYKTVAVPVSKAIADLAKATHTDLGVNAPLDSQPIILRFQDLPLKDAMDKIAAALHGTWTHNKTAYTLQRTDDIVEALQQADYQERYQAITKALLDSLKYRAQTPFDEPTAEAMLRQQKKEQEEGQREMEAEMKKAQAAASASTDAEPERSFSDADMQAMQAQAQQVQDKFMAEQHATADGRFADRVFAAIDPDVLAANASYGRIVLSTNPRPLQFKLNMSSEDFQALIDEQNAWTQAKNKVSPESEGFFSRKIINTPDARVVVELNLDENGVPDYGQFYILDSKGRQLAGTDAPPTMNNYGGGGVLAEQIDFDKLQLPSVKLSPLAREMVSLIKSKNESTQPGTIRPASLQLRNFLSDPAAHDPLSLAPSEVLLGIAEAKSWNLVAVPPDDLAMSALYDRADEVAGGEFLSTVDANDNCEIKIAGGWLALQPKKELEVEGQRTDRASLGDFVQAVTKLGYASIDDMASFAGANQSETDPDLARSYVKLIIPEISAFDENDWHALRFLGLLSDNQKQNLQGESRLSMASLSQDQMDSLLPLILSPAMTTSEDYKGVQDDDPYGFGGFEGLPSQVDEATPTDSDPVKDAATDPIPDVSQAAQPIDISEEEGVYKPMEMDITEVVNELPDPIGTVAIAEAPGTAIRAQVIHNPSDGTEDSSRARTFGGDLMLGGGDMGMGITDGWTSPMMIAMAERRKKPDNTYTYAVGTKKVYQLKIRVAKKMTLVSTLTEYHSDLGPYGPISKLPDNIRKYLDAAKKMYDQMNHRMAPESQESAPEPKKADPPRSRAE